MDNNDKKKNLFWILSGVAVGVLLIGWLVGWWMITSSTADQEAAREGVFNQVTNLQSATIPNTKIEEELAAKKEALTDHVFQIWQERYKAQDEHFKNTLSDKTQDALALLGTTGEVQTQDLDKYHQVLKEEILSLYDVIKLRLPKGASAEEILNQNQETGAGTGTGASGAPSQSRGTASSSSGGDGGAASSVSVGGGDETPGQGNQPAPAAAAGRGGRGGNNRPQANSGSGESKVQYEGIVDWQDRARVLESYFGWGNTTPTSAQVKYGIEYWASIYAVLDVVAKTNGDVQQHFEAPIKQIRALRIGRIGPQREGGPKPEDEANPDQPLDPGSNQRNTAASSSGGDGGDGGAMSTISVSGNEEGGSGGARGAASTASPAYSSINPEWGVIGFDLPEPTPQPSSAADLEKGRYVDDNGYPIYSASANPHVEFRMIPLYMELVINQNEIDRFFDIAANSPLPIEVQQICAIHAVSEADKNAKDNSVEFSPNDVVLKIRGVIYFYQPPVRENLGKKPADIQPTAEAAKP